MFCTIAEHLFVFFYYGKHCFSCDHERIIENLHKWEFIGTLIFNS